MSKPGDRLYIFKVHKRYGTDVSVEYGWRVRARNGRLIATSGESFKRRSHAVKIAERVTGLTVEPAVAA